MREYLDLVREVLDHGVLKPNRTGVDTLSCFGLFYRVDLAKGFPLLTTKKMQLPSILHELFWYLSGEHHIRELRARTKIWDDWADPEGRLHSAYGRFWRRFPVQGEGLPGEKWSRRWVREDPESGGLVFDQIQYVIDTLKEARRDPKTTALRRLVVTAWHPANAAESRLPPCHYTFCFQLLGHHLNCHLTQRSADLALGVPFNLACYAALTGMIAAETGFEPGCFAHSMVDAHIYVNHIDKLKIQLEREPRPLPRLKIASKPFAEMRPEDLVVSGYEPYPGLKFEVAV